MPRVIRGGDIPLLAPDAAAMERRKAEELKKAIKRIKRQKKLRKREKRNRRRKN